MKKLLLILGLLCAVTCRGSIVVIQLTNWYGTTATNHVKITPVADTPLIDGSYIQTGIPKFYTPVNGNVTNSMNGGNYQLDIAGISYLHPAFFAVAQNDTNTVNITNLFVSGGNFFNYYPGIRQLVPGAGVSIDPQSGVGVVTITMTNAATNVVWPVAGNGITATTNGLAVTLSANGQGSATNVVWPVAGNNIVNTTNGLAVTSSTVTNPVFTSLKITSPSSATAVANLSVDNAGNVTTNFFLNRKYYVDVTNGLTTGIKGRVDSPWNSLQAAQLLMSAGDSCVVADGTYTTGLWKSGCTFELGDGVIIAPTSPALALAVTNGTFYSSGGLCIQGDYFQTNATVSVVKVGILALNTEQLNGMSAAGSSNYCSLDCNTLYFLIDKTTNLTMSIRADSILNFGQVYPGANISADIWCRRFEIDSDFGGVLDANSDLGSSISIHCDIFNVDFAGAFQFATAASPLFRVSAQSYKLSNLPTVGTAMTLNGGVLGTAVNSGQLTNLVVNGVTIDTTLKIPFEPRSKYYDVIGL